jgi:hypothetical protein
VIQARDIDGILGLRLVAFADGEGCFYISNARAKGNYFCGFVIKLREDDQPVLERYRDGCGGIGRLVREERNNAWAPTVRWEVTKKHEVGVIRDLFELYPLWSKKRQDFEIWKHAVDFCIHCVGYRTNWSPVAQAKADLAAARAYLPPAALTGEAAA